MAIDTESAPINAKGTEVSDGNHRSIITDLATYTLRTGQCKLARVIVWGVGTTWTLAFYDSAAGSGSKIWETGTIAAVGIYELQIPCKTGLTVVSGGGGAAGGVTVVWA